VGTYRKPGKEVITGPGERPPGESQKLIRQKHIPFFIKKIVLKVIGSPVLNELRRQEGIFRVVIPELEDLMETSQSAEPLSR